MLVIAKDGSGDFSRISDALSWMESQARQAQSGDQAPPARPEERVISVSYTHLLLITKLKKFP